MGLDYLKRTDIYKSKSKYACKSLKLLLGHHFVMLQLQYYNNNNNSIAIIKL